MANQQISQAADPAGRETGWQDLLGFGVWKNKIRKRRLSNSGVRPLPLGMGMKAAAKCVQHRLAMRLEMCYNLVMEYKSNKNVVYSCKYHVVWCPTYRRKVRTGKIEMRLKELIEETASAIGAEIIEMEIMPDHVHLLIEVDPQYGINKAVRHIKGVTSHTLRLEFPSLKSRLPSLWTNSYFVSTVGGAPLEKIKEYIENQKDV